MDTLNKQVVLGGDNTTKATLSAGGLDLSGATQVGLSLVGESGSGFALIRNLSAGDGSSYNQKNNFTIYDQQSGLYGAARMHINGDGQVGFGVSGTGFGSKLLIVNDIGSANAFDVQSSSSVSLFRVEDTNSRIAIGVSDTTGVTLVLDTKTNAGEPRA